MSAGLTGYFYIVFSVILALFSLLDRLLYPVNCSHAGGDDSAYITPIRRESILLLLLRPSFLLLPSVTLRSPHMQVL